jgi:copper chaperone CopZ
MKNSTYRIFLAMLLGAFLLTGTIFAEPSIGLNEVKIKTSAYSWMCKNKIETNVNKMAGVEESKLNLEDKVIAVTFDPKKITADELVNSIKDLGYEASIEKKEDVQRADTNVKDKKQIKE